VRDVPSCQTGTKSTKIDGREGGAEGSPCGKKRKSISQGKKKTNNPKGTEKKNKAYNKREKKA